MPKKIAIVDETAVLEAIEGAFSVAGYHVTRLATSEQLFIELDREAVDLVMMEIGTGADGNIEIFKRLKAKYPQIVRIALSPLSDSYQVYKTIEGNFARLFLYRSWDIEALIQFVGRVFEMEEQFKQPQLLAFINSIEALPTIPVLYQQVSQMVASDVEVERIATVIESDPAITSSILRVANSAFYGAKTGSIAQAIMFIGLGNVKNIILCHSTFMSLGNTRLANQFWEHAVLTNRITHQLYEHFHKRKLPLVNSSAGLLHNVGMLLMLSRFKDDYEQLLSRQLQTPEASLIAEERKIFDLDHAALGAYLLNWWELPMNLVEVAMDHHKPRAENSRNRDITFIVHLSEQCAWYLVNNHMETCLPEDAYLMNFGLSRQQLILMLNRV